MEQFNSSEEESSRVLEQQQSNLVDDDVVREAVSDLLPTASLSLRSNSRRIFDWFIVTTPACRVRSSLPSVML